MTDPIDPAVAWDDALFSGLPRLPEADRIAARKKFEDYTNLRLERFSQESTKAVVPIDPHTEIDSVRTCTERDSPLEVTTSVNHAYVQAGETPKEYEPKIDISA